MTTTSNFQKHFVALSGLFILGDSVIGMPYASANDMTFLAFLLCCVLTFLLYLIILPIIRRICLKNFSKRSTLPCKIGIFLLFFAVSLYALWTASYSFTNFVTFVKRNLLQETSLFFITVIYIIVIAVLAGKRQGVLLKFSLLAGIAAAISILLFFALSSDSFDVQNIMILNFPTYDDIVSQSVPYIGNMVFPALLLPVYQAVIFKESNKKSAFCGLLVGVILLGLCIINSILIFGSEFAAKLDFPYASAISTVTIGQLFTRMDGFSYFIYFAGSLIKITVCIDIIKGLFYKMNDIHSQKRLKK